MPRSGMVRGLEGSARRAILARPDRVLALRDAPPLVLGRHGWTRILAVARAQRSSSPPRERIGPDPTAAALRARAPSSGHAARGSTRCAPRVRAPASLMSWLPLSAGQRLGNWFAPLAVRVPGRARNSMMTNLGLWLPELGAAGSASSRRRASPTPPPPMLELGPLWAGPASASCRSCARWWVSGASRGAIASRGAAWSLLGPHLGSWEIVVAVGERAHADDLALPAAEGARARGSAAQRARALARTSSRPTPAACARSSGTLRRGEVVGVLPDQDPGRTAASSRRSSVSRCARARSAVRLIAGTDAVPILGLGERLERGRGYRIHFLELDTGAAAQPGRRAGDARASTSRLEGLIRRYPDQYLWTYRRFRVTRPPGGVNPYRRGERADLLAGGRGGIAGVTRSP